MEKSRLFFLTLLAISLLGIGLRFIDYDKTPQFGETQDEFFYPWAGMTWLQTGNPIAWSWFPAYTNRTIVEKWGIRYPLVSPWIEKPPLYTLIMGAWMTINGITDLFDVRLTLVRIVPVTISFFTILLTGYFAKQLHSKTAGVIAALLYATVPTIVLANRLSLTENLLTPLIILGYIFLLMNNRYRNWNYLQPFLAAFSIGLAILTKNIAIAGGIAVVGIYIIQKKWQATLIAGIVIGFFVLIHPLIGLIYDWKLYSGVMADYQREFSISGSPEFIATIFLYPTISSKDHVFLDGAMLIGYLLLFISPFWLLKENPVQDSIENQNRNYIFLSFPLIYLGLLSLLASGQKFSYYGWHLYPLYPYLMILLSIAIIKIWKHTNIGQIFVLALILGSSSLRFLLLLVPTIPLIIWPGILFMVISTTVGSIILSYSVRKIIYVLIFSGFVLINIITSFNLTALYFSMSQPLN